VGWHLRRPFLRNAVFQRMEPLAGTHPEILATLNQYNEVRQLIDKKLHSLNGRISRSRKLFLTQTFYGIATQA
jgi:hypothetical protein